MRYLGIAVFCFALVQASATAQSTVPGPLAPGTRVRIDLQGERWVGGIHSVAADTLALLLWEQPVIMRVPLAGLEMEVSRGHESRWASAGRWAWRSALAFVLVGALSDGIPEEGECTGCATGTELYTSMVFGGALIGATYGAFAPRERWISVAVPLPQR